MSTITLLISFWLQAAFIYVPVMTSGPSELRVAFNSKQHIELGSPVMVLGNPCGKVTEIAENHAVIKIQPICRSLLRDGSVALTATRAVSNNQIGRALEVISPNGNAPLLANDDEIKGYSSFSDYWRNV